MKHNNLIHGVAGTMLLFGAFALGLGLGYDAAKAHTTAANTAWESARAELHATQQTLQAERRMQGYFCECAPGSMCSYAGYGSRAAPSLEYVMRRNRYRYTVHGQSE